MVVFENCGQAYQQAYTWPRFYFLSTLVTDRGSRKRVLPDSFVGNMTSLYITKSMWNLKILCPIILVIYGWRFSRSSIKFALGFIFNLPAIHTCQSSQYICAREVKSVNLLINPLPLILVGNLQRHILNAFCLSARFMKLLFTVLFILYSLYLFYTLYIYLKYRLN